MDARKYSRSVGLNCETCGNDQFHLNFDKENTELVKCSLCERIYSSQEIVEENRELVDIHLRAIKNEISKDFAKEAREALKRAFRGSKNFRVK